MASTASDPVVLNANGLMSTLHGQYVTCKGVCPTVGTATTAVSAYINSTSASALPIGTVSGIITAVSTLNAGYSKLHPNARVLIPGFSITNSTTPTIYIFFPAAVFPSVVNMNVAAGTNLVNVGVMNISDAGTFFPCSLQVTIAGGTNAGGVTVILTKQSANFGGTVIVPNMEVSFSTLF